MKRFGPAAGKEALRSDWTRASNQSFQSEALQSNASKGEALLVSSATKRFDRKLATGERFLKTVHKGARFGLLGPGLAMKRFGSGSF